MANQSAISLEHSQRVKWGAFAVLAIVCISLGYVFSLCLESTNGHFSYGLDDPYIHLSIARNLAFHGVWGVTPFSHSSASSSPLWTLLLAIAIRLGGDNLYWPLIFGIVAVLGTTMWVYLNLIRQRLNIWVSGLGALTMFAIGPLHMLPFTGMEHCLQILLDLIFGFWLLEVMGRASTPKDAYVGALLSALMCLCRYESVFLIALPVIVCLWRRQWLLGLSMVIGSVLAVVGFAIYSHSVGMPFIPNSIVLKGSVPHLGPLLFLKSVVGRSAYYLKFGTAPVWDLLVLMLLGGIGLRIKSVRSNSNGLQIWLWTVVAACALHAGFATIGIFYRYEAYLLTSMVPILFLTLSKCYSASWLTSTSPVESTTFALMVLACTAAMFGLGIIFWALCVDSHVMLAIILMTIVSIALGQKKCVQQKNVVWGLMGSVICSVLYLSVVMRAISGLKEIPRATQDIFLQQTQMAKFVSRYYPNGRIAVNDIGAVTYFNHIHLLDLFGLASDNIRDLKLTHTYNTEHLAGAINQFKPELVIAYPNWFQSDVALPKFLIPVASWTISNITSAGGKTVCFYSLGTRQAARLETELKEFQLSLPTKVHVEYFKKT